MITVGEGKTQIPIRSLWFLLIYASGMLESLRSDERRELEAGERDLDLVDAIAEVLVDEVERRLRENLTPSYRPVSRDLTRVRGRVDHLRTSTNRLMDRGRIACTYSVLTADTPRNRFVAYALRLSSRIVEESALADRCGSAAFAMERLGVRNVRPDRRELSKDRLSLSDSADRRMFDAARLIQDMAIPLHASGDRMVPVLVDDHHKLRRLFEKAVRGYLHHALDRSLWRVASPNMTWASEGTASARALLPRMETDTVVESRARGRKIVVETKFTDAMTSRHESWKVEPGYMFQLYGYLMSQTGLGSPIDDAAEGVLLFAQTAGREPVTEEVHVQGHRIRIMSVDLTETPNEIRARWRLCVE